MLFGLHSSKSSNSLQKNKTSTQSSFDITNNFTQHYVDPSWVEPRMRLELEKSPPTDTSSELFIWQVYFRLLDFINNFPKDREYLPLELFTEVEKSSGVLKSRELADLFSNKLFTLYKKDDQEFQIEELLIINLLERLVFNGNEHARKCLEHLYVVKSLVGGGLGEQASHAQFKSDITMAQNFPTADNLKTVGMRFAKVSEMSFTKRGLIWVESVEWQSQWIKTRITQSADDFDNTLNQFLSMVFLKIDNQGNIVEQKESQCSDATDVPYFVLAKIFVLITTYELLQLPTFKETKSSLTPNPKKVLELIHSLANALPPEWQAKAYIEICCSSLNEKQFNEQLLLAMKSTYVAISSNAHFMQFDHFMRQDPPRYGDAYKVLKTVKSQDILTSISSMQATVRAHRLYQELESKGTLYNHLKLEVYQVLASYYLIRAPHHMPVLAKDDFSIVFYLLDKISKLDQTLVSNPISTKEINKWRQKEFDFQTYFFLRKAPMQDLEGFLNNKVMRVKMIDSLQRLITKEETKSENPIVQERMKVLKVRAHFILAKALLLNIQDIVNTDLKNELIKIATICLTGITIANKSATPLSEYSQKVTTDVIKELLKVLNQNDTQLIDQLKEELVKNQKLEASLEVTQEQKNDKNVLFNNPVNSMTTHLLASNANQGSSRMQTDNASMQPTQTEPMSITSNSTETSSANTESKNTGSRKRPRDEADNNSNSSSNSQDNSNKHFKHVR